MKILVTGATGFIGRHLVPRLLQKRHSIIAVARDKNKAESMPWYRDVDFIPFDVGNPNQDPVHAIGLPDVLIHLAWPDLDNYRDPVHYEVNLPAAYRFIRNMVEAGTKQVVVTGTCLEYGKQEGILSEETPAMPDSAYGIAKDTLRKFLQDLQNRQDYILQWIRLFYMYGPDQNPRSLFSQLDRAIDQREAVFNMSGGEQLRDYLHVEEVADRIAMILEHPKHSGVINVCSGKPVSVRRLVEQRIAERKSDILLNLGHFPYPDYEAIAFWGNPARLNAIMGNL